MLGVAGGILLAVGVVSLFRPLPFHPHFLFSPISLGLGASMFTYGTHLAWRARAVKGIPAPDNREEQRLAAVSTTLGAIAVILSLFWGTADFADALGLGAQTRLLTSLISGPALPSTLSRAATILALMEFRRLDLMEPIPLRRFAVAHA
jgi:hypothetical protein